MKNNLFLFLFSLSLFAGCKENATVFREEGPAEFQMTKEEEAATGKWKNKPMETLATDAFNGDRGALYMQGMCFLMGWGWPVDTESANFFFSQSASFGFAPALDHLRLMYNCDENNPLLAMVYLNLEISRGHEEFIFLYHKIRSDISANAALGPRVAQEIERLAIHKNTLIQQNNDILKSKTSDDDKKKFITCYLKNITYDDVVFDHNYWQNIRQGYIPNDNEIFCLAVDRNAKKSQANLRRLNTYNPKDNS